MAEQTQSGDQSSSQGGSQTQATSTSVQGNGSQASQSQQTGSQQQTQQTAPARPEYIPETHWDATAGKVKDDAALAGHFNEIIARDAAEQSRKLTLPANAEAYEVRLPETFQAPQGTEFKIDADNPLWSQARTWAHKNGISQEAFAEGIALIAGDRIATSQQITAARNAEVAKLGTTGPARVDAVTTFFKAHLGDADGARLASRLFTADDVKAAEKLVARFASQGGGDYGGGRREADAGAKVTPEQWNKMTYSEQKEYAARHSTQAH